MPCFYILRLLTRTHGISHEVQRYERGAFEFSGFMSSAEEGEKKVRMIAKLRSKKKDRIAGRSSATCARGFLVQYNCKRFAVSRYAHVTVPDEETRRTIISVVHMHLMRNKHIVNPVSMALTSLQNRRVNQFGSELLNRASRYIRFQDSTNRKTRTSRRKKIRKKKRKQDRCEGDSMNIRYDGIRSATVSIRQSTTSKHLTSPPRVERTT